MLYAVIHTPCIWIVCYFFRTKYDVPFCLSQQYVADLKHLSNTRVSHLVKAPAAGFYANTGSRVPCCMFYGKRSKTRWIIYSSGKRCSCYGHWRKQYEKIKEEQDSRSSEAASPTYGRTLDKTRVSERLFVTVVQYFHLLFGRLKGDDCFETEKKLL